MLLYEINSKFVPNAHYDYETNQFLKKQFTMSSKYQEYELVLRPLTVADYSLLKMLTDKRP